MWEGLSRTIRMSYHILSTYAYLGQSVRTADEVLDDLLLADNDLVKVCKLRCIEILTFRYIISIDRLNSLHSP